MEDPNAYTTEAVELLNELRNQALDPRNRRQTLGLIDRVESLFHAQDTDLTTLHAELTQNQQELTQHQQELSEQKREFEQQRQELAEARAKLFFFEEQARIRAAHMFGRHSEKWRRDEQLQAILFNELELALQEAADSEPPPTEDDQEKQKKQARAAKRAENPEGGRAPLPEELPRETTVLDIDESERACDICGTER